MRSNDPSWQWYTQSQARGMFWLTVKKENPQFLDELATLVDKFDGGSFPFTSFVVSEYFEPFLNKYHIHYESKDITVDTRDIMGLYEYTSESWLATFILLTASWWIRRPKRKEKRIISGKFPVYLNDDVNQNATSALIDPDASEVSYIQLTKILLPDLSPEKLDTLDKRYWQDRVSEEDYQNSIRLNFEFSVEGWDWQRGKRTSGETKRRIHKEVKKIVDEKINTYIEMMKKAKKDYLQASKNEFRCAIQRFFHLPHDVDSKEFYTQSNKIGKFIGLEFLRKR